LDGNLIMAVTIDGDGTVTGLSTTITNKVLEQFFYPCNGETVTTSEGDITLPNVTAVQNASTTFTDLTGSSIAYTPPTGTKTVIYKFCFQHGKPNSGELHISNFKFFIDSTEVLHSRTTVSAEDPNDIVVFEWPIRIGGTADTNTGRLASWSSDKTLKMQIKEHHANYPTLAHEAAWWDSSSNWMLSIPRIGITALST